MVRVAVVGLGWWGRIIVQLLHGSAKLRAVKAVEPSPLAVMARFRGGGHALISAILATPFEGRVAVYGSRGWAEVRDKAHPESPQGWTLTTSLRGQAKRVADYPPAPAVLANLEAFADAIEGRAPYPVPHDQMISTVATLEAVVKSTRSGAVEAVA